MTGFIKITNTVKFLAISIFSLARAQSGKTQRGKEGFNFVF